MKLLKRTLAFLFLCSLSSVFSFAQDLRITNQRGTTYSYQPSLSQRISGVKKIYFLHPGSTNQDDRYVCQNFKVYLQRLGLSVVDKNVGYSSIDASQGTLSAYILRCTEDDVQKALADILEVNALAVVCNITHAYGYYTGGSLTATFIFIDPQNGYQWSEQFDPANTAERYIKQCQSKICSSYSYNPSYSYHPAYLSSNYTKSLLRSYIDKGEYSAIEGVYEGDDYTLGVKKGTDGVYYLLYHSSKVGAPDWKDGYVKAVLRETSTSGVYRATWYGRYFDTFDYKIIFENGMFTTYDNRNNPEMYLKMYPTKSMESEHVSSSSEWSGTGFALKNGYIVTNFHVVNGAKSILVYGVNGQTNTGLTADIVATDKTNDLAIIKISDSRFSGFGNIPYAVKNQTLDVGENVWVLGYPLTQYLGNEIKLTNGLVSSKSGYQGDVATYQISAPVQPGNSGGPMFDSKGNIVGVVNAGVPGAENVGYAIKTNYLFNLADSYSITASIPTSNTISSLALTDQVKRVKDYVFLLMCSAKTSSSSSGYGSSTSTRSTTTSSSSSSTSSTTRSSGTSSSSSNASSSSSVDQMTISRSELTLNVGQSYTLTVTNNESSIKWESTNPKVATVSSTGVVKAISPGVTTIWATAIFAKRCVVTVKEGSATTSSTSATGQNGTASSNTSTSASSNTSNNGKPQMIDLGLSVKWADRNVGADSNSDYGDFFAWGETEAKEEFKREGYKWFKDNQYSNPGGYSDIAGTSFDAATMKLGGSWRMPTEAELEELITKCTWTWSTVDDVEGYKVVGKNGNSIFIPANGTRRADDASIGSYWSSEASPYAAYYAYILHFEKGGKECIDNMKETFGCIRPVSGTKTLLATTRKKADGEIAKANQQYSQGDYQGAYVSAGNSIKLMPNAPAHHLRGYLALYMANELDVAKESFLYCINNGYRVLESRIFYARSLMENDEYKEAIKQYDLFMDEYQTKDYDYLEAWYNKIHCYSELKDWAKTISEYQNLLEYEGKVDFDYGTVYNNIAWAYLNLGQTDKAVSPIQKAIKLNHNQGYIWDTLGEVQFKTGDFEQCVTSMTNAIAMYKAEGNDGLDNSFYYRGMAKVKTGNLAGGYVDLERASDLGNTKATEELKKINAANIDFSNNGSFKHTVEKEITSTYAGEDTKIIRIELTEESTILYFQYTNVDYETGGWYSIDPDTYLRDKSTGKKYLLLTAVNCAISPRRTSIEKGKTETFCLIFPALPEGTSKIDFVETEDSEWKFYNIDL